MDREKPFKQSPLSEVEQIRALKEDLDVHGREIELLQEFYGTLSLWTVGMKTDGNTVGEVLQNAMNYHEKKRLMINNILENFAE